MSCNNQLFHSYNARKPWKLTYLHWNCDFSISEQESNLKIFAISIMSVNQLIAHLMISSLEQPLLGSNSIKVKLKLTASQAQRGRKKRNVKRSQRSYYVVNAAICNSLFFHHPTIADSFQKSRASSSFPACDFIVCTAQQLLTQIQHSKIFKTEKRSSLRLIRSNRTPEEYFMALDTVRDEIKIKCDTVVMKAIISHLI